MTDETHLLGEPDDYADLAHLPPKERARMRRLRNWLAVRSWSPSQALAVLCGYDPEVGPNTCAADMAFLPGTYAFHTVSEGSCDPDDLMALDAGIEEQRGLVGGLRLTTMPPAEAIAKAVAAGVPITWLEAARADPECRKYLPPEALDAPADALRTPMTSHEVASLGGKARWRKNPKKDRFLPIIRELHDAGHSTAEIIRQLVDRYGDEPDENQPSSGSVYRWVGKIEKAKNKTRAAED